MRDGNDSSTPGEPDDREPWPISANPGGQVAPRDHIGHETELFAVMRAAARSGARLTGDRRMGKTSMLNVVEERLEQAGHVVVRMSAETEHLDVFAARLLDAIKTHSRFKKEARNWSLELDVAKYGFRIQRSSPDPKDPPSHSDDLFTLAVQAAKPARLVLLLDEITVLAHQMHLKNPGAGQEFLRSLRRARQLPDGPVMVFAGSVGMHHALEDNTAINDLTTVHIGPLQPEDAVFLARCLLLGEDIACGDPIEVANTIATEADGIAYYIHHIAEAAVLRNAALTPAGVREIVTTAIENSDDPWQLEHYDDRLDGYYGPQADTARAILDHVAVNNSRTHTDIVEHLKTVPSTASHEPSVVLDLLAALERDHYLRRDGDLSSFASELLRRSWLWIRRL